MYVNIYRNNSTYRIFVVWFDNRCYAQYTKAYKSYDNFVSTDKNKLKEYYRHILEICNPFPLNSILLARSIGNFISEQGNVEFTLESIRMNPFKSRVKIKLILVEVFA